MCTRGDHTGGLPPIYLVSRVHSYEPHMAASQVQMTVLGVWSALATICERVLSMRKSMARLKAEKGEEKPTAWFSMEGFLEETEYWQTPAM